MFNVRARRLVANNIPSDNDLQLSPDLIDHLYEDSVPDYGNCCNAFHGLGDVEWWLARQIWGETRNIYNINNNPLGIISSRGSFRKHLIHIVDSPSFSCAILFVIMVNSILIALDSEPSIGSDKQFISITTPIFDIFLGLFTLEAALKIMACGFVNHRHAYLRGSWNRLDLFIVIVSYVGLHPAVGNVSVVRSLRLLHPLRSISRVKSFKSILVALVHSIPALWDVIMLLLLFMTVFSITGVVAWAGKWHQRCFLDTDHEDFFSNGTNTTNATIEPAFILMKNVTRLCTTGPVGRKCNNVDNNVELPQKCRVDERSYKSQVLNFDNVASATLLVFKIISLDDWPLELERAQDVSGTAAFLYFLVVTLLGSFFCMNLVLAILTTGFGAEAEKCRNEKRVLLTEATEEVIYPVTIATCHSTHFRLVFAIFQAGKPSLTEVRKNHHRLTFVCDAFASGFVKPSPKNYFDGKNYLYELGTTVRVTTDKTQLRKLQLKRVGMWSREMDHLPGMVGVVVQIMKDGFLMVRFSDESEWCVNALCLSSYRASIASFAVKKFETYCVLTTTSQAAVVAVLVVAMQTQGLSLHSRLRLQARKVIASSWFNKALVLVTVLNVLILCVDHHGIEQSLEDWLAVANYTCSFVFCAELMFKLWGLGLKEYFSDRFNCFDAVLVVISVPEMVSGNGSALSAFRAFRILRVMRLARKWVTLRKILATVLHSISAASSLCLIMLLFIFIYTILGLQFFSSAYPPEERNNFNNIWHSALTVFVVITGETWTHTMEVAIRETSIAAILYFCTLFWLGNYIFVNLFIAILIDTFANEDEEENDTATNGFLNDVELDSYEVCVTKIKKEKKKKNNKQKIQFGGTIKARSAASTMDTIPSDKLPEWLVEKSESRESEAKPVRIIAGKSLGVFSVTNPIRVLCTTVVWHKQFKTIMLILISLNVLALGLEAPWNDSYPTLKDVLNALEIVFVIVFTIEAAMKIIATGLYKDSLPASYRPDEGMTEDVRPYLVSKWNRIDFTVVAMSWLGLFIPFFTLLRCARSLRILIRNRNVKVVVSALFQALPAMGNVVLVVGFVFVIFGVLGVQLFKGAFYSCNAPDILLKSECNGTGPVPSGMDVFGDIVYLEREREWVNKPFHFDNIGSALLALLEMGIGDGWANIMFAGIDSKSHEEAPERDSNPVNAIYFVLFVASGSFFAINLFIGLLIDRFNELKGELDGSAFLTEDQQAWLRYNRVIGRLQLVRVPDLDTWLKRKLSQLVFSKQFETMIILCIVVNVAFMGARHYNQTDEETLMQYVANTVFAGLFAIEAALKIFVMRKLYFTDSWNKFDFSLVLLSFVGFFLGNSNIQVLRILRICRVMRLIKKAQGLEKLFGTLFFSLPSFMNISLLLLVVYYNFGVVGVQAFGRVGKGLGITKWTNFENLGNAIMTLYIMSTTENWAVIMRDAAASNPGCEENNSCGSLWAYLYFPCFTVLGGMIVLNLVITVVLENFGEQESLSVKAPSLNLVSDLRVSWAKYDPQLTGKITVSDFLEILDMLPQPLGFASGGDRDWTLKFYILKKLHVPVIDEYVFYQDILNAYIGTIFNISREGLEALQNYAAIHGTMGTQYMLYDVFAVYTIQRAWRNRLRMRGCTKKRVAPPDNPLTEKPEEEEEEEEYEFKEDQRAHPLAVPTE